MKLIKPTMLTVLSMDEYEFGADVVSAYRNTLTGTDKEFSDDTPDDYDFIVDVADEFYEWLFIQWTDEKYEIKYNERTQLINGEYQPIEIMNSLQGTGA